MKTQEKIIEIIDKYDQHVIYTKEAFADEILSLHNAELAKHKELVGVLNELNGMYYKSIGDNNQKYLGNELRQKIDLLTKEIGGE